MKFKHQ